jgi:hypothetical protein
MCDGRCGRPSSGMIRVSWIISTSMAMKSSVWKIM